jgi:O-antigen/teichoic acid export membrane protein
MASILRSILMALEQYRPISLTLMAASLLQLALIGLVAFKGWGAPGFVAAMLSGNVFQFVALLLALRMPVRKMNVSHQRLSLQVPQRSTIQHYLAFLLPSTLCLVTNQIVWERSEVFFLRQANSGMEEIGFYSLAYTIFSMFFVLGGAFLNPFRPSISYDYGAGNWGSIQEKMQQGVLIATLYGVPLSLGGWITLDSLIPLLVTQKMQPAADVARVLFMGMIPATIGVMLGLMLGAANGIWTSARLGIIMSVVNISLDMFLIPRFHALGGAVANTSSQIVYVLLLFVAVRQLYAIVLPWRTMGMVFLIGLLTTFVVPWGVQVWLPGIFGLFLAIGLGGGLYLATLWFLGYLKIFFESRHTQSPGMVSESVT